MAENNIQKTLTSFIKNQLDEKAKEIANPIFVFVGVEQYVNMDVFMKQLADKNTFFQNGNKSVFSSSWFAEVFSTLNMALTNPELDYTILSFAQFSYLISYIQPDFFKERLVIVQDGFRALLPLPKENFIEKTEAENIEERSEAMPIYMAEQMQIGNNYYYSAKMPIEVFTTLYIL